MINLAIEGKYKEVINKHRKYLAEWIKMCHIETTGRERIPYEK